MRTHGVRIAIVAVAAVAVLGTAAAALVAGQPPSRGSLMAQFSRGAARAATPVSVYRASGTRVAISPARAAVPNQLSVRLAPGTGTRDAAPLLAVFSMPAMNMRAGYAARLRMVGPGRYSATIPVLGMAGLWQVRLRLGGTGSQTFTRVVHLRLAS
jgi:hypothetical protein